MIRPTRFAFAFSWTQQTVSGSEQLSAVASPAVPRTPQGSRSVPYLGRNRQNDLPLPRHKEPTWANSHGVARKTNWWANSHGFAGKHIGGQIPVAIGLHGKALRDSRPEQQCANAHMRHVRHSDNVDKTPLDMRPCWHLLVTWWSGNCSYINRMNSVDFSKRTS